MHVTLNLAMSLDGKIAPADRGWVLLGTPHDRRMMTVYRSRADVVLMGSHTVSAEMPPVRIGEKDLRTERLKRGIERHPQSAVMAGRRLLDPAWPFFARAVRKPIVYCGRAIGARQLARLAQVAYVLPVSEGDHPAPGDVLADLERRGHAKVLLEGGGEVNWLFFEAGLVDRIHVTLCPLVIGGRAAPTIAGGAGWSDPKHFSRLKLVASEVVGDEIYLTYDVVRRGSPGPETAVGI